MKNMTIFLAILVLGMQSIYADTKNARYSSSEDTVRQLYHDYAWEALGLKGVILLDQPKQTLEKYFESSLANSIAKDGECRSKTQSVCHIDFNIIFSSQDPAATDLEILPSDKNGEVIVRFKYPSTQKLIELKYSLINTKNGWRIHDIHYDGGRFTLREILERKN